MVSILGISAFYHDSAAAIIQDGQIIAAAQEERFSRKKHDPGFPGQAIKYCLDESGVSLDDLDAVVFYDKPLLKFERILDTFYAVAPKGLPAFLTGMPLWLKEKLLLKKLIRTELKKIQPFDHKKLKLLFSEHHLSHAASAFFPSNFDEAAVLTIDGVGEWETASIWKGRHNQLIPLKTLHFPHSLGLFYSAFTYWLGFKVNSGEYKLMGLAPYGNPDSDQVEQFKQTIKQHLIFIFEDGSIWLNQKYFKYTSGLRMVKDSLWTELFGFPRRASDGELTQLHCDLALAAQQVTEEVVLKMAGEALELTRSSNICLAGGVALNGVANGKLLASGLFKNIFIQPASGDAGGALGAALAIYHQYFQKDRVFSKEEDGMQGALLGPQFGDLEVEKQLKKYNAQFERYDDFQLLIDKVAQKLTEGKVVGWFQGRMEFGPRALGNRSILANPVDPEMQLKLNLKIKKRENFRPFAPAVLKEDVQLFFDSSVEAPYMLLITKVRKSIRKPLSEDFQQLGWREKLDFPNSELPAVTHVDYSARLQTVSKEVNPKYWALLQNFKEKSGRGVLVNTSFNVRGEPIVCSPEDGYRCFMKTEMDLLVVGNLLFEKEKQGAFKEVQPVKSKARISSRYVMESCLALVAGLLLLWWIYQKDWILMGAFAIAVLSLIFPFFANGVGLFWRFISKLLEWIMPKIVLSLFYYGLLTPIAFLFRLTHKYHMDFKLKAPRKSLWLTVEKSIKPKDFEKPW